MKIKLNKKEIQTVERKTATFDNGVVCKYVLTNSVVTEFEFFRDKTRLYVYIPETVNTDDLVYNNFHKSIENIKISSEEDIVEYQNKVHRLYRINSGLLMDCNNKFIKMKLPLMNLCMGFMEKNDEHNIKLLAEFLSGHSDFEIVDEIKILSVPSYAKREYEYDDEDNQHEIEYEEMMIDTSVRFKNVDAYETYMSNNMSRTEKYFSLMTFTESLVQEFKKKYPNL